MFQETSPILTNLYPLYIFYILLLHCVFLEKAKKESYVINWYGIYPFYLTAPSKKEKEN